EATVIAPAFRGQRSAAGRGGHWHFTGVVHADPHVAVGLAVADQLCRRVDGAAGDLRHRQAVELLDLSVAVVDDHLVSPGPEYLRDAADPHRWRCRAGHRGGGHPCGGRQLCDRLCDFPDPGGGAIRGGHQRCPARGRGRRSFHPGFVAVERAGVTSDGFGLYRANVL
ncbi:Flagellar biosynthesis protein FlhA, partial [Pseudomonas sp. FG-3G]